MCTNILDYFMYWVLLGLRSASMCLFGYLKNFDTSVTLTERYKKQVYVLFSQSKSKI